MRTSLNWEMVRYSTNLTPTVVFGRFPSMPSQNCSQSLSNHLDVFVSSDSHLVSAPLQRSSNVPGPRYLRAWRRPSVRWMMSSLTGWTSQNVMDAYERSHLQEAELTLNDKSEFSRCAIRFLTHIIDSSELHANPQRTAAVTQFPVPLVVYSDSLEW